MTYDTYRLIFLGSAVAAGVMLVLSILLFVFLKIPAVVGYLTGRTARRAIESMRTGDAAGTTTSGTIRRRAVAGRQHRAKTTEELGRYEAAPGMPVKDTSDLTAEDSGWEAPDNHESRCDIPDTVDIRAAAGGAIADTTDLRGGVSTSVADTRDLTDYMAENADGFKIEFEITFIHTGEIIR